MHDSTAHSLGMLQEQHEQLQLVAALMRGHLLPLVLQQLNGCIKLLQANAWSCCCQVVLNMLQQGSLQGLCLLQCRRALYQLQERTVNTMVTYMPSELDTVCVL